MTLIKALAWIVRILVSVFCGGMVMLVVFWTLWRMVGGTIDASEFRQATRIEFTRMRKDTEVESKREQRPERERPPEPPKIPSMSFNAPGSMAGNVAHLAPTVPTGSSMSKLSMGAGSDRSTIPLVRINPDYPQRALMTGQEGWVLVQFTITGTGAVKDVSVVKSSNRIFEQPAVKAILRWRYRPRVENGEAVDTVGVRTIIRFALDN